MSCGCKGMYLGRGGLGGMGEQTKELRKEWSLWKLESDVDRKM